MFLTLERLPFSFEIDCVPNESHTRRRFLSSCHVVLSFESSTAGVISALTPTSVWTMIPQIELCGHTLRYQLLISRLSPQVPIGANHPDLLPRHAFRYPRNNWLSFRPTFIFVCQTCISNSNLCSKLQNMAMMYRSSKHFTLAAATIQFRCPVT